MMMENNLQMSMNGFRTMNNNVDAQWIQIQRNTFTNWVNEQLKRRNIVISDIAEDLRNGVVLIQLVEELSGKTVNTQVLRPQNQHEKLQNVSVALDAMSRDGVRSSNIDSTDIVRGNVKLILSLIWQLILRYQVGLSAVQHRQWFLKWLKAVLQDCVVTNFGRDWNDGVALYALLEYCQAGLCPNWPNINRHDRLNNCRNAMKLAAQYFGIPIVLRPEDLASPDLDERSAMTYLSYFIKLGGPGYLATLDRIQSRISCKAITNFTTDWQDGEALAELVTNSGRNLPDLEAERGSQVELIRKSMNVGKYLGVEPVLTAEDITEETKEHLGMMTYVSQFLSHIPVVNYLDTSFGGDSNYQTAPYKGEVEYRSVSNKDSLNRNAPIKEMNYLSVRTSGGNYQAPRDFTNPEVTYKRINMDNDSNYSTRTSTLTSNSVNQPHSPQFHLVRHAGTPSIVYPTTETSKIDCYSVGVIMETNVSKPFDPERVRVEAVAPTGRVVKMTGDGNYTAQFMHTEIGEWNVTLYYKDKYLDSCPIDICDPSQVQVKGLKGGVIAKTQEFFIDSTKGGDGTLEVDIKHNERPVVSNVTRIEKGVHRVTYTPYDPGPYLIDVRFNGAEVRDSEFYTSDPEERQRKAVFYTKFENVDYNKIKIRTSCDWEIDYMTGNGFICHITDGSDIQVYGMNDGTICSLPQLIADCTKSGNGILQAEVVCNGEKYPSNIEEVRLNVYRINFRPHGPGIYKIWLTYDGKSVKGSPFIQEIDDIEQPVASGEGLIRAMPNRTATFVIDPRGVRGNVTVNVLGPSRRVESQLEPQSNGTVKVYYTATEKGSYVIDVKVDNKEVEGSPFKPWVVDPSLVRVSGGWKSVYGDNKFIPLVVGKEKQIPFDASEAGFGELTAEVRGPTGKIPVAIDARSDGKNRVIFTPRVEGRHDIDVFWGGYPLLNSPYPGYATYKPDVETHVHQPPVIRYAMRAQSPPNSLIGSMQSDYPQTSVHGSEMDYRYKTVNNRTDSYHEVNGIAPQQGTIKKVPLKVILKGKGLKEAYINEEANFAIDATQCTAGVPDAKMSNSQVHIPIRLQQKYPQVYQCSYIPRIPGEYLLYIKWNNQALRGSPFKVDVKGRPAPVYIETPDAPPNMAHKVRFVQQDINNMCVGKDVDFHIDTRDAGPGKLVTKVIGPQGNDVPHEVASNPDGTMKMRFLPTAVGTYIVDILFNDAHIHGSPYYIDIKASRPTGFVKVWGPGIESGVKGNFKSHFWVEADGAGAGELRVKIMGPKGAFHVKMRKASKKGKLYQCFYNPSEPGKYVVEILWSGRHIDGSPFIVYLGKNQFDLDNQLADSQGDVPGDVLY